MKQHNSNSNKKIVFLSHFSEEAELANLLKVLIEQEFLEMIEVFVSSDGRSIPLGTKWLEGVTEALETCVIAIILCSPHSISRPWINFEAGAAWIRKIPIITLCHSGTLPANLPIPFNSLQGGAIIDEPILRNLFKEIAKVLHAAPPNVDFTTFLKSIKEFEKKYTDRDIQKDDAPHSLKKIKEVRDEVIKNFTYEEKEFLKKLSTFDSDIDMLLFSDRHWRNIEAPNSQEAQKILRKEVGYAHLEMNELVKIEYDTPVGLANDNPAIKEFSIVLHIRPTSKGVKWIKSLTKSDRENLFE